MECLCGGEIKCEIIGDSKCCVCEKGKAGWIGGLNEEPFSGDI